MILYHGDEFEEEYNYSKGYNKNRNLNNKEYDNYPEKNYNEYIDSSEGKNQNNKHFNNENINFKESNKVEFNKVEYNKSESMDHESNKPVDVRIIVENPKNSEYLSKSIKNIELDDDFNIAISSIITTNNIQIAKNAVQGADIILIAINYDEDGKKLFSDFYESLKDDLNYVEFLKFPKSRDLEFTDNKIIEDEIKNSIIRAGLNSIFNVININHVRADLNKANDNYSDLLSENEKKSVENDVIIAEANDLRQENKELNNEINRLKNRIEDIKSNFADFKSRFSNLHTKNLLEIFSLKELWMEVFNEPLEEENDPINNSYGQDNSYNQNNSYNENKLNVNNSYDDNTINKSNEKMEKIVIATNKFQPENIIIGQGWIGAASKEDAIDWLKIIRTALIFVDDNKEDLKEEFKQYNKDQRKRYSNDSSSYKEHDNYQYQDYNGYEDSNNSNGPNRDSDNSSDDEDSDYEIPNTFQNFWE